MYEDTETESKAFCLSKLKTLLLIFIIKCDYKTIFQNLMPEKKILKNFSKNQQNPSTWTKPWKLEKKVRYVVQKEHLPHATILWSL